MHQISQKNKRCWLPLHNAFMKTYRILISFLIYSLMSAFSSKFRKFTELTIICGQCHDRSIINQLH